MGVDYTQLHDPNAEYTMRDLSAETMNVTRERGDGQDIEITDIQTTMVDGNFPWTLVRIYTDAGIVGTGEAYWGGAIPELIERMTPFLQGENPLDIDRLTEHLIQKMSGEGSIGGVTVTAISGIGVALHDLAGKILDVPAYQLLGGKYHSYELGWWADLVDEDVIEDGSIEIPEKPGLGVTLNLDAVEEYMVEGDDLFDEA